LFSGTTIRKSKEKHSVIKSGFNMGCEEFILTTPLKHKVKVRMKQVGEDVWDTSLFYADQVRRVGKFQGKRFAMEAATKKAIETADSPSSTPSVFCLDDDSTCKTVSTIPPASPRIRESKTKTVVPARLTVRTSAKPKKKK
jgi:hypothetical protein